MARKNAAALKSAEAPLPQTFPIGEWMPLDSLIEWDENPRHNDKAAPRVAESIKRFGFVSPIVIWTSRRRMVAGHTRLKAMRLLLSKDAAFTPRGAPASGLVPVRFHEFESEAEANLYALADNALGEIAEWNEEKVGEILGRYDQESIATAGMQDYVPEPEGNGGRDANDVPDPPVDPITKPGDIWTLGRHRLLCGDSTIVDSVKRLMGDDRADCMWTDPPYGVAYVGKTKNKLTIANDNLGAEGLEGFLGKAFGAAEEAALKAGAAIYVAHPAGALSLAFLKAFVAQHWRLHETLVWVKDSMVLGHSDYHYMHEPILFGYKPGEGRRGRGGEGWYGDNSQVSVFSVPRPKASEKHPTMKPVELVSAMVRNSAPKDGLVFEPFGGSGSTLIACEQSGRRCNAIELSPAFCDVIVERWELLTGGKAVRT